jgi:SNF2 family DNA or RNA helicase
MPATLRKEGDSLVLDLSTARGLEFKDGLDKIRDVPGRKYDPDTKCWSVEATIANADRIIHSIQPDAKPDVLAWVRRERINFQEALTTPLPDDAELQLPWEDKLYPFQRAFVDLAADKGRIINGDDMGLGKTVQAIATIEERRIRKGLDDGPKILVSPNSVKGVWARELRKWIENDVALQIIDGTKPETRHAQVIQAIRENAWAITNYEQLRVKSEVVPIKHRDGGTSERKVEVLKEPLYELPFLAAAEPSLGDLTPRVIERARNSKHRADWFGAIADEAHRAKNRRALQTLGLHRTRASAMMIAQTGTPIMNTPDELWSLLHWLWPEEYTSYWRFYENYVDYIEGYFGKMIVGVRNPDALRFELRDRLVRRTKHQVLKDLPEKTRVIVPVTLAKKERQFYEEVASQVWVDLLKEAEGDEALSRALETGSLASLLKIPNGAARMTRLQEVLEHPATIDAKRHEETAKMDACEEIILDNRTIPHVVFCMFKPTVTLFAERLRKHGLRVAVFTGDVKTADRTDIEDEFQRGELDIIVGTIASMYQGITLSAASTEHFLSRGWVPAIYEQAEDRCHRIGQPDPVTIYIYEAQDTVDDGKVRPTNRRKEAIVKTVLPKDDIKEEQY